MGLQNQPGTEPHHVDSQEVAWCRMVILEALATIGCPGLAVTREGGGHTNWARRTIGFFPADR